MSNHIVENLKKEIENFSLQLKVEKVGQVLEVFDGIAKVSGLSEIRSSEMVTFPNGEMGVALNLEEDAVGVIILGDFFEVERHPHFAIWKSYHFGRSNFRETGNFGNPIENFQHLTHLFDFQLE